MNLLLPEEVALMLRIAPGTLADWRTKRRGPAYVKVGSHVRYRAADVQAYIDSQLREPERRPGEVVVPIHSRTNLVRQAKRKRHDRTGGYRTQAMRRAEDEVRKQSEQ